MPVEAVTYQSVSSEIKVTESPFIAVPLVLIRSLLATPPKSTTEPARVIVPQTPSVEAGESVIILLPSAPVFTNVNLRPASQAGKVITKASVATVNTFPLSLAYRVVEAVTD